MRPNPQETADLVTFTEEIHNGKLHFLCGEIAVNVPFTITTFQIVLLKSRSVLPPIQHVTRSEKINKMNFIVF